MNIFLQGQQDIKGVASLTAVDYRGKLKLYSLLIINTSLLF